MRNTTMNKSTLSIATVSISSLLFAGTALADFQGFSIDEIDSGLGIGTTYRVYVNLEEGDQLDAVFGDGVDILSIKSDSGFYQNQFGTYGAPSAALFDFFPSLRYDSFVTIGVLDDSAGDAMMDIGIDWTDFENNGGDIWTDNGTWFATPDDAQVMEVDGRVLIGQFTMTGLFTEGDVSLQGKNADLTNWQRRGVSFIPAPGAIALLGLAGVTVRRRRK
jgi:hypothetical protein